MDGEWEAPRVPNPVCQSAPGCGEWNRPTINNPKYKGKWKPPLIDNPDYQVPLMYTVCVCVGGCRVLMVCVCVLVLGCVETP